MVYGIQLWFTKCIKTTYMLDNKILSVFSSI